jgi:isopentenyldiphosphate isomerase
MGGGKMKSRYVYCALLTEILQSQDVEIANYRWRQTQQLGQEIDWNRAASEWLQHHFPDWKRFHWQQAVQDALRLHPALN